MGKVMQGDVRVAQAEWEWCHPAEAERARRLGPWANQTETPIQA